MINIPNQIMTAPATSNPHSWCSRFLHLLTINPCRALSGCGLSQPTATLRSKLHIDAATPDIHGPLVGRLQVRGGTAHRLIWQW